jgi:hypothetical protein
MNQLTKEQIARILQLYMPCKAITVKPTYKNPVVGTLDYLNLSDNEVSIATEGGYYLCEPKDCRLLLTPLSKITDEDAIEVATIQQFFSKDNQLMVYRNRGHVLRYEIIRTGEIIEVKYYYWSDGRETWRSVQVGFSIKNVSGIFQVNQFSFQYLISKGYAVPLFIAPSHPCNGKTAIDLELAFDQTKEVAV